jgi:hypothetical protein
MAIKALQEVSIRVELAHPMCTCDALNVCSATVCSTLAATLRARVYFQCTEDRTCVPLMQHQPKLSCKLD